MEIPWLGTRRVLALGCVVNEVLRLQRENNLLFERFGCVVHAGDL